MTDLITQSQVETSFKSTNIYRTINEDEFRGNNEEPIFTIAKVEFNPPHEITQLIISNNIVVMSLINSHIIRIKLQEHDLLEGKSLREGKDNSQILFVTSLLSLFF
jgi:hypothetical protein